MGKDFETVSVRDNTERGSITSVGDNVMSEADSSEVNTLGLNSPQKLEADEKDMMTQGIIAPCSETATGWDFPAWQGGAISDFNGDRNLLASTIMQPNPEADAGAGQPYRSWRPTEYGKVDDINPWKRGDMGRYTQDLLEANQISTDKPHTNAFRHAYISAYEAYMYGSSPSQALGTGYEISTSISESFKSKTKEQAAELQLDHATDLHNNKVGRNIGWNAHKEGKSWSEVENTLLKAITKLPPTVV